MASERFYCKVSSNLFSFEVLDKENLTTSEVRRPKQFTDKITFLSTNINGIRGEKTRSAGIS
jgi:hypothetical protein